MELKITKEKVLQASCECPNACSVLKNLFPEAFKPEFCDNKIYAIRSDDGNIYKLHRSPCFRYWSWIDISTSDCHANGKHITAEDALESYPHHAVFKNQDDFFKWALVKQ